MNRLIYGCCLLWVWAQGFTGAYTTPSSALKTEVRGDLQEGEASRAFRKGRELAEAGKWAEALPHLEKSLAQEPTAVAWYWVGYCQENLGKLEAALHAYDRALAKKEDLASAWWGKGLTLLKLQRYTDAASAFERMTILRPTLPEGYFYLGAAHWLGGQHAAALPPWEKALELHFSDSLSLLVWIGEAYWESGDFAKASSYYQRAAQAPSAPPEAFLGWGKALYAQGNAQAAIEPLSQAEKQMPSAPEPSYYKGLAHKHLNQWSEARAAWQEALRRKSDHAGSHYELGLLALKEGKTQEAQQHYEQLKQVNTRLAQKLLQAILNQR
jgi:tetratricopeptide (TPR) repeat protein